MAKIVIGVMGPGDRATQQDCQMAYQLGLQIAQQGWILLTGGRSVGVMEAASQGAQQAQGLTVGILPTANGEQMSAAVDVPILTDMGSARNNINVLSSRVVIACGWGAGTVSEIALAIKADRPVVLLGLPSTAIAFFQDLAPGRVAIAPDVKSAIQLTQRFLAD